MFNLTYKLDLRKVKAYVENVILHPVHPIDHVYWLYKKPKRMLKVMVKDGKTIFSIHKLNGSFWEYTNYEYDHKGNHKFLRNGKYPAVFTHTK